MVFIGRDCADTDSRVITAACATGDDRRGRQGPGGPRPAFRPAPSAVSAVSNTHGAAWQPGGPSEPGGPSARRPQRRRLAAACTERAACEAAHGSRRRRRTAPDEAGCSRHACARCRGAGADPNVRPPTLSPVPVAEVPTHGGSGAPWAPPSMRLLLRAFVRAVFRRHQI